ncbi:hypothetical protein RclHR1_01320003 [Rhizophagus clarus]|uniref:DDE-1 domain-containing protein n=1 Tax=Rhizophagus clarus TaxID=94130 RepID=A0A2Z6R1Q8_9GLOM|nr:hypothetical protein RclHR1_01320003 [Rhizophagus clarus]
MQNILKEREMITLYGGSAKKFKTSCQWISSFMKRYKLSWRRRTKIFQKLPSQTEETLAKFHQFINNLRTRKSFDLCNIFNMDETPVWFDMAGEKIPPDVVVWFQDKGWMDSELMNWYIDYLGDETNKRTGAGAPKLMVYDSFRGHLKKSVKEKFCDYGFDLGVIPGGLTSLCQPLDVMINKPFKANLRKEWHLWMAAGVLDKLIKIIIDSFTTYGISNALDDIEDFDNEIIDISDDDLEDGINNNLENDGSDDNLEDDISWDDLDIDINE